MIILLLNTLIWVFLFFNHQHPINLAANTQRQPTLTLHPSRSYLQPGDSITVDCVSSDGRTPVQWKREGNQALPYNIRVSFDLFWVKNEENLILFYIFSNTAINWLFRMFMVQILDATFVFATQVMVNNLNQSMNWVSRKNHHVEEIFQTKLNTLKLVHRWYYIVIRATLTPAIIGQDNMVNSHLVKIFQV